MKTIPKCVSIISLILILPCCFGDVGQAYNAQSGQSNIPSNTYLPPSGNNPSFGGGGTPVGGSGKPSTSYIPPANDQFGSSGGDGPNSGGSSSFGNNINSGPNGEENSAEPEPFSFSYEVKDEATGNDYSHHQESDGRSVRGEYKVLLPDGRNQVVSYTADEGGYNADVKYDGEASNGSPASGPNSFPTDNRQPQIPSGGNAGYPSGKPQPQIPSGGNAGYPSGKPLGNNGYQSSPQGGGGYPSGKPQGNNGYPSNSQGGGGYPSGNPQSNNGYPSGPQGGGGYPSGPSGGNGYPSGKPQGNGNGYPSGPSGGSGYPSGKPQGNNNGYPSTPQGGGGYPTGPSSNNGYPGSKGQISNPSNSYLPPN